MTRKSLLSDEEHFAKVPKRRVTGGAVFLDPSKTKILMVKPWYKDYWTLPGGIADEHETLKQAAAREVMEEIGIKEVDLKFIGVGSIISTITGRDVVHAYFYGGILDEEKTISLNWDHDELDDCKYISIHEITEYAGHGAYGQHLVRIIEAALDGRPYYFEETR